MVHSVSPTQHRRMSALLLLAVLCWSSVASSLQVAKPWSGTTIQDLHREYGNIFKFGNRNAASHLWSTFLLERSEQLTAARLELMFSGFCAVSGLTVRPNDYNRYGLSLPNVGGGPPRQGYLHYCCWPCVCDTQDFIRVDTKTVQTRDGPRLFHFAVLGNPCDHEEKLQEPFTQPFGQRRTTLSREAAEVRCGPDGELLGATLSDHGFVIISMFFDLEQLGEGGDAGGAAATAADGGAVAALGDGTPQPGRVRSVGGVLLQDESEYGPMCMDRAANGYNSGMGEIFRKVAAISPIAIPATMPELGDSVRGRVMSADQESCATR